MPSAKSCSNKRYTCVLFGAFVLVAAVVAVSIGYFCARNGGRAERRCWRLCERGFSKAEMDGTIPGFKLWRASKVQLERRESSVAFATACIFSTEKPNFLYHKVRFSVGVHS